MSKFTCEVCFSECSTKSNLNRHKTTNKKCLSLQGKVLNKEFPCEYCSKVFISSVNRASHLRKCDSYLDRMKDQIIEKDKLIAAMTSKIQSLEEQIRMLSYQLSKKEENHQNLSMAAVVRPTTSVRTTIKNSVIQGLLPIKEEEMKQHVSLLTLDDIRQGAEGYAKFAMKHPLKGRITCTDASRKKLAWKNEIGEIVYDIEGQALCKKFFAVLQEKSESLFRDLIKELGDRLGSAYERQDQEEADAIVELTDKVQTWRREAFQASKGTSNDLTLDFASYLCKMSVSDPNR